MECIKMDFTSYPWAFDEYSRYVDFSLLIEFSFPKARFLARWVTMISRSNGRGSLVNLIYYFFLAWQYLRCVSIWPGWNLSISGMVRKRFRLQIFPIFDCRSYLYPFRFMLFRVCFEKDYELRLPFLFKITRERGIIVNNNNKTLVTRVYTR